MDEKELAVSTKNANKLKLVTKPEYQTEKNREGI